MGLLKYIGKKVGQAMVEEIKAIYADEDLVQKIMDAQAKATFKQREIEYKEKCLMDYNYLKSRVEMDKELTEEESRCLDLLEFKLNNWNLLWAKD